MGALVLKAAAWFFSSNIDALLTGALNIWAKSKDVDLTKFTTSVEATAGLSKVIVDANERFAEKQMSYALTILNWRGFRILLWVMMAVAIMHYALVVVDTALPKIFHYASWDIDPVQGSYAEVTKQLLLFFVIAKPIDTVVGGALNCLSAYLRK
jgi:hypothetical protein